jgi:two-component system, NarL family, sensor histidine kinase DegS
VPLPPLGTSEFTEQLTQLDAHTRQELEQSQQQQQEIRLLLGQTASEVEKLGQREIMLANRVRDMEVNLDSYSRADIRTLYNTNHEVQLRLFMMRSQAEQLESRQQNLRDYQEKLRTIVELLQVQQELLAQREASDHPGGGRSASNAMVPAWQHAVEVIEGQEEERRRLASEIQDGPTQSLTNLLLHLEVCRHVLKRDVESAQKELDALKGMLTGTLQETRRLLSDLRPLALEELGIVETLRRHLQEVSRTTGLEASISAGNLGNPLPHHLQIALYRLLQGAIEALAVPGQNGRLTLTLQADADRIIAQADVAGELAVDASNRLSAYLNEATLMRRLELLEGFGGVEPDAGQGTRLVFQIPTPTAA